MIVDNYEIMEDADSETFMNADVNASDSRRTALIYLVIAVLTAIFGAVYEYFSFGVFSAFMLFAFAIPLILGALPFYITSVLTERGTAGRLHNAHGRWELYHAAIATLTIGSIMKGVLDIYGTTNRLLIIYPVAGVILAGAAIATAVTSARSQTYE